MSAKSLRANATNRAKPKKKDEEKRVVYKSVLDNPYRIRWPSVPINVQNMMLAQLVSSLDGASERMEAAKKRKRETRSSRPRKKAKTGATSTDLLTSVADPDSAMDFEDKQHDTTIPLVIKGTGTSTPASTIHPIWQHLAIGINEVTKKLELQASPPSVRLSTDNMDSLTIPNPPPARAVFVCRDDVDPTILIDHIPHLIAAVNSSSSPEIVKLVPLPKGAEATLSQCLGLKRVAVLAILENAPFLSSFTSFFDSIPTLSAPWLTPPEKLSQIIPTHVKHVRSTQPKDMKKRKEERSAGRAAAKARKSRK